ncbi:MAG: acyl-CoA thioesterase [Myxococcota bacterium]|nr:acyl-CoA thioesterase [Myxococcota bacterium]
MMGQFRTVRVIMDGLISDQSTVSRLDYRVGLLDCDMNRHMTNSRYPHYLDLGRWHLMMNSGAYRICLADRCAPMVVELNLAYWRELRFGAKFYLDTRLVRIDHKCLHFEQYFLVDGRPHCRAEVKSLLVQRGRVIGADGFSAFIAPPLAIDGP